MDVQLTLTLVERDELAQHEEIIERGLKTFVNVGLSLLAIRDKRLYRDGYGRTFEDYCRERWGWERRHAYRLMDAASAVENVSQGTHLPSPENERQVRPLTELEPEQQREAWAWAVETAPDGKITGAHVQEIVDEIKGNGHRPEVIHISDDSYEWYTPAEYIEAARGLMGEIDLDPASSENAQMKIKAGSYYTKEIDGLAQPWYGRVWLNPPYNMPLVERFTGKAIDEYEAGNVDAAVILVNNATDTAWFHRLLDYPVCFTKGRVRFWSVDGPDLGARQGQAIFYLGDNPNLFTKIFSSFGVVLRRYDN